MTKRVLIYGTFRMVPSGRDHPTIREGLSSQEGVEWSGSRAVRRAPSDRQEPSFRRALGLIFLLVTIKCLSAKLNMGRQFSLQSLAARNSMVSATSDSNIIKLNMEIQKE